MNRIEHKFQELKRKRKKAFIAFLTSGDPSLAVTRQLVWALEKVGVDLIELGVPFSDPLADGSTIQDASLRALRKGVNLKSILKTVKDIRRLSSIPIALMTYYNPVYSYGEDRFIVDACKSGVDGLLIPDLPPEESPRLVSLAKKKGLSTIFFLSPTTSKDRMKKITAASTGFIYYVSLRGVTGERAKLPADLIAKLKSVKKLTKKPVCVGFGISTPAQVRSISKVADGVIVGSAIIKEIEKHSRQKDLLERVSRFVKPFINELS